MGLGYPDMLAGLLPQGGLGLNEPVEQRRQTLAHVLSIGRVRLLGDEVLQPLLDLQDDGIDRYRQRLLVWA